MLQNGGYYSDEPGNLFRPKFALDGSIVLHVDVQIRAGGRIKRLRPSAGIFRIKRAWNQRAERGYMKQIEDRFQSLADRIVLGETSEFCEDELPVVNEYFSLWYHRSRVEPPEELEMQMRGLTGDHDLTLEQEENLEANHVMYARNGGRFPMRQIVGMQIQTSIMRDMRQHRLRKWGIIRAIEGEFLVADVPAHDLIPLTPTILLAANHASGYLTRANLIEINTQLLAYTRRYHFARDILCAREGIKRPDFLLL